MRRLAADNWQLATGNWQRNISAKCMKSRLPLLTGGRRGSGPTLVVWLVRLQPGPSTSSRQPGPTAEVRPPNVQQQVASGQKRGVRHRCDWCE
jgi:hypothetical protein